MARATDSGLLVIGVGNPYRRDDAAGLHVITLLQEMGLDRAVLRQHSGEGASLMDMWQGASTVILIDAVSSGAPPGTVHRLEPLRQPLPRAMFRHSTHAFSVPEAVELARALNQLPKRLLVIGIEGQDFSAGTELSPAVAAALPEAARMVLEIDKVHHQIVSED
jgi:hydrogenase maturation protease